MTRRGSSTMTLRRAPGGFTLIEVMLAGVIFLLALSGTIMGISAATKEYEHQRMSTAGIAVLESVMEELLLLQATDDRLADGVHERYFDMDGNEVATAGEAEVTARWRVVVSQPVAGLRTVFLEVSWTESSGVVRSLSLETWRT